MLLVAVAAAQAEIASAAEGSSEPDLRAPSGAIASRLGPHVGVGVGPTMSYLIDSSTTIYGVATTAFLNIGLTPLIDLRAGIAADGAGSRVSHLSVGAPIAVRFNLGDVYSALIGGSVGLVTDTSRLGLSIGPEWSVLTYRFGALRQFELSLHQAIHFYVGEASAEPSLIHFQNAIVLSHIYYDHDAGKPRFSGPPSSSRR
jgi:hypothetical protein